MSVLKHILVKLCAELSDTIMKSVLFLFCDVSVDLLGLLKWKDHLDKIDTNLEKLMSLEGEEIVKVSQSLVSSS